MPPAIRVDAPSPSFLRALQQRGHYVDCYALTLPTRVSHADFVLAFYTTPLFRTERFILRWAANRPSTDEQARALASGGATAFAVWRVAQRADDEIMLTDESGRTSSWLKVEHAAGGGTTLLFGSSIEPRARGPNGERRLTWVFRALLGAHEYYSRRLLEAAAARLLHTSSR